MARYESWIERAKSSIEIAQIAVSDNVYYEDLCYQTQQAVEKGLKGLLIYYGVEPEFTHNIRILLDGLKKIINIPENINEAINLTKYAILTRYPGEYDEVTKERYQESVKIAKECLEWIEETINECEENKKLQNISNDVHP